MQARTPPRRLVILGHPISHSLSPVFQNAALVARGIAARYDAIDVAPELLRHRLDALAREGAAGNITIPHKEAVATEASCSSVATRVGAVNTFWHDDGALIGHNTDVDGAAATILALVPDGIAGRRCALIGAGGSAAAVLVALHDAGCRDITIAARTGARAEQLLDRLQLEAKVTPNVAEAVADAALVINATPIGMISDDLPVAPSMLAPSAAVFDLVYRRDGTPWVNRSRAAGHRAEDGLRMLLEQGAAAFACWFGDPVPRHAMWKALGRSWPDFHPLGRDDDASNGRD